MNKRMLQEKLDYILWLLRSTNGQEMTRQAIHTIWQAEQAIEKLKDQITECRLND